MGLLDSLAYDPQMALGMGLLGASGNSRTPVSLGQALGAGWGNMQEAQAMKQKAAIQALQAQQMQSQMAMSQLQMDQLKKQIAAKELFASELKKMNEAGSQQQTMPYGGDYSPSVKSAFGIPQTQMAPQVQPQKQEVSIGDLMMKAAIKSADADAIEQARKMQLEEKKLAPKFASDVRIVMKNNVPTAVQMADDGTVREMTGYSPAEKLHFADNGQMTGIGIDQYTGKVRSPGMQKMQSPDSIASNALGWANYNKPSIQNIEGVGLMQVNPRGTASPVTMNGKPVVQDKPLTEAQGKAAGFADRMAAAERIMSDPKFASNQKPEYAPGVLRTIPAFGTLDGLANQLETSSRQQVRQSQEDWVRAALRLESGAVIGKDEMDQEIKTFFPQAGDSPEVMLQKQEARVLKQQGIARQGGPGYKPSATVDFSQLRK